MIARTAAARVLLLAATPEEIGVPGQPQDRIPWLVMAGAPKAGVMLSH